MYRKLAWGAGIAITLFSSCTPENPLPKAPPFEYTFGGASNEVAGTVIESMNGDGILLVGGSKDEDKNDYDLYMVRVDLDGNELWSRKIGEKGKDEIGFRALRSTAGEYVIFGTTAATGPNKAVSIQFTFLNDDFEVIRQTTTPTILINTGLVPHNAHFSQLSDGGFFVGFAGTANPITMRFDADGNMIEQESYSAYNVDENSQLVTARHDGGFAIAVNPQENYSSYSTLQILLLDQFGNYESIKTLPTYFYYAKPLALCQFGTDRYALSMSMSSDSGSHAIVMLDSLFNDEWTTVTNDQPFYNHIGVSSQRRLLLSGDESVGYGYGSQYNIHTLVYDSTGVYSRAASYGGSSTEILRAAVPLSNGKTVLFGETQSYGNGGTDLYVIYYQE